MKGRRVLGLLGIVAVIVLAYLLISTPAFQAIIASMLAPQRSYPEEVRAELLREMSIDANGGRVIDFTAEAAVPRDVSFHGEVVQEVIASTTSPSVTEEWDNGTGWWRWEGDGLEGDGSFSATVSYEVRLSPYFWDLEDSLAVDDVPSSYDAYMGEEWLIDPTLSEVASLSGQLTDGDENVATILRSIYDWMRENVAYPEGSHGPPQDPSTTLSTLVGDCDDQSILFCSLARAAGVPAWLQVGLLYDRSSGQWGGHAWVQACVPTAEGVEEVVIDTVNDEFMFWDPYRIMEYTSDGDGEHTQAYYQYFHCHIDPGSYAPDEGPEFAQTFTAISYETEGTVTVPA